VDTFFFPLPFCQARACLLCGTMRRSGPPPQPLRAYGKAFCHKFHSPALPGSLPLPVHAGVASPFSHEFYFKCGSFLVSSKNMCPYGFPRASSVLRARRASRFQRLGGVLCRVPSVPSSARVDLHFFAFSRVIFALDEFRAWRYVC